MKVSSLSSTVLKPLTTHLPPLAPYTHSTKAEFATPRAQIAAPPPVPEPTGGNQATPGNTASQNETTAARFTEDTPHGLPIRPKIERIVDAHDRIIAHDPSAGGPPRQLDREFTVHRVVSSQVSMRERRYQVRWADSVIRKDHIETQRGRVRVSIGGQWFEAARWTERGEQDADGVELCDVEWEDSWMAECELPNAAESIAEFENQQAEHVVQPTNDEVRRSIERTGDVDDRPRAREADGAGDGSPATELVHDRQPHIPKQLLIPEFGADYRPGLRELIERTIGEDCPILKKWPADNEKRHLLFNKEFTKKGSAYEFRRDDKINAAFAHVAGEIQTRPCESCKRNNGPFMGCVVASGFATSACTNCAIGWHAKNCNYHLKCEGRWTPAQESSRPRFPSPIRLPPPRLVIRPTPPSTQPSLELAESHKKSQASRQSSSLEDFAPGTPNSDSSEDILLDINDIVPLRRSKRTASSAFLTTQPHGEHGSTCGDVGVRSAKSPRLSDEPLTSDEDTWVKIEATTYPITWKPTSFRHPGCGGHENRPCQHPRLVPRPEAAPNSLRLRGRVLSDRTFTPSEITEDEVRYVFGCSPCYFVESLHSAWQTHKHKADDLWTRESFAAKFFCNELNEGIRRFCPRRQLPKVDHVVIEID